MTAWKREKKKLDNNESKKEFQVNIVKNQRSEMEIH